MTVNTSLDLTNLRKDLSDALSWRVQQTPSFIKLFQMPTSDQVDENGVKIPVFATGREHFWLEGTDRPKTCAYTAYAYSDSTGTFTVASSSGWAVGDRIHLLGDSAVLQISAVTDTSIAVALQAANGSSATIATIATMDSARFATGTLVFDSRPIQEKSTSGEDMFRQSGTESNYSQIFRGEVGLSGTALAVEQYGNENDVNLQLARAVDGIIRRMNHALLFGVKTARTASVPGTMGGLYYYGTQSDGLSCAQSNSPALTMGKINVAAQNVTDAGGTPDLILCGAGQAQVISTFMNSQVQITNGEQRIGQYVNQFVTSAGGSVLRVFVEPAIPDADVWVIDSSGFALLPLRGRALHSSPANSEDLDGTQAKVLGEYTAEFKNAKTSLCRISGLKKSAETLG